MIIAIEGIDASGKRTQTDLLCVGLQHAGYRVAKISFPRYGKTFFATSITQYLQGRFGGLESVDPNHAALLYAGDRLESRPLLRRRARSADFLIIDRYVASNIAHQASRISPPGRDEFIRWLTRLEYGVYQLPPAELTIYLDMPASLSAKLIAARRGVEAAHEGQDIHEQNLPYLEACRDVYRGLAATQHGSAWATVSCADQNGDLRAIEAIQRDVLSIVLEPGGRHATIETGVTHPNGIASSSERVVGS